MSIWVRSQGKMVLIELRWCVIIPKVINSTTIATDGFEIRGDCGVTGEDGFFFVGRYPTKEEALKVLDMIQEHVGGPNNRRVFQMPEAGFSVDFPPGNLGGISEG